jgi:hypothetical protein
LFNCSSTIKSFFIEIGIFLIETTEKIIAMFYYIYGIILKNPNNDIDFSTNTDFESMFNYSNDIYEIIEQQDVFIFDFFFSAPFFFLSVFISLIIIFFEEAYNFIIKFFKK